MTERSFTARWRVRSYELDSNGHVNNAVYLAYAEELATLHAEALGEGLGGAIRHITQPATAMDSQAHSVAASGQSSGRPL